MIRSSSFSNEEKKIIKLIVEKCATEPVCILDFLRDNYFIENALLYDPQNKLIAFASPLEKNIKEETAKFWDLYILFKYLEDNMFIVSVPFDGDKKNKLKCIWSKAPNPNCNRDGNSYIITENYKYSNGQILRDGVSIMHCYVVPGHFYNNFELFFKYTHATKRLVEFVERDFKSLDELALEELRDQSLKIKEMANKIENQSNQLKEQTNEIKKQSKDLTKQLHEAKKQSIEASRQSRHAKCQTICSLVVVFLTLIVGITSCLISYQAGKDDLKRDDSQKPISVIDSSLNIFVKDSINLKLNDIRLHQNDSVIIKSPLQSTESGKAPKIPSKPTSRTTKK